MLYEPREVINVRNNLQTGFLGAGLTLLSDMITGANKPWAYYVGVALGGMAAATGIPGAAATLYAIGDTVDALLFKSPDGSLVRVYLNGIAHATIDTYAAAAIWETFNVNGLIGGAVNRIDFVNESPSPNPSSSGIAWLAIGQISVNSGIALGAQTMAYNTLSFRVQDSEQNSPDTSIPVYLPTGWTLSTYQGFVDTAAPKIDAVTGGKLTGVTMTIELTLPGGLKANADAGILNERGGLITFDTTGPRADSVRIPAIKTSIMPGNDFPLNGAAMASLIAMLTGDTDIGGVPVRPRTSQDHQFSAARRGSKSFRK